MNQIADILNLAAQAKEQNMDAVLATVVRTEGSAYRQAGAMMLICADGRSVGMISGGCLEPHIIRRAFWLTRNGANIQVYQTGDDLIDSKNDDAGLTVENGTTVTDGFIIEDANKYQGEFLDGDLDSESYNEMDGELNFGLGCNGRVHVLFERLATATPLLDLIRKVRSTQQPVTIATLIKSDSAQYQTSQNKGLQYQIGTRINLDAYLNTGQLTAIDFNQTVFESSDSFINNTFTHAAKQLAGHTFRKKNAEYVTVENDLEKGLEYEGERKIAKTEWLVQRIFPQIRLLICGAGNDVMPLVIMAKLQDWHVTVIDSRPQYATLARFSQADVVKCLALDGSENLIKLSYGAAVALMSHSLSQDRARLNVLLEHSAQCQYKYLGQLGPRYRTERLIKEISAATADPAVLTAGIKQLHYPIGYKLGGDGPEALALSIMAQMSAVIHGQAAQVTPSDSEDKLQTSMQIVIEDDRINGYAHD